MRTSNPILGPSTFSNVVGRGDGVMTVHGTVNKTAILVLLCLCGASFTWSTFTRSPAQAMPWALAGGLGGFVVALVTCFKKEWAGFTAPLYAVLEGLMMGAISAYYESRFNGVVIQAVGLTLGTLFCLLVAYRFRLIKATENFRLGIFAATGAIAALYLVSLILGLFGTRIPFIHESGWMGIGFSLFVVVIAALNLVLDFDFIEQGAAHGAPKYLEWYAAFGLMVTLVWLYLEILRLLGKLATRRS